MNCRPVVASISPQEGLGGCVAKPRKLSEASIKIAAPSNADIKIKIGATTFGRTWRNITR